MQSGGVVGAPEWRQANEKRRQQAEQSRADPTLIGRITFGVALGRGGCFWARNWQGAKEREREVE